MRRPIGALLIVSAIVASGAIGLAVGRSNGPLPAWLEGLLPTAAKPSMAQSEATGPIIYYRNPDGVADYSLTLKQTSTGKDYAAVHASEDVSFEEIAPEVAAAKGDEPRRIRFYRNPWATRHLAGPKKFDGDGHLPVYEGRAGRRFIDQVSAAKLQRHGRSDRGRGAPREHGGSCPAPFRKTGAANRVVACVSKVCRRVENVTTGTHVHKGQRLMRIYGASRAAPNIFRR